MGSPIPYLQIATPVFHDHALASAMRKVEQRFRLGHIRDLTESISKLIEDHYEFSSRNFGEVEP